MLRNFDRAGGLIPFTGERLVRRLTAFSRAMSLVIAD
jgi:hypothetical protein